jgi:hypothetical protein
MLAVSGSGDGLVQSLGCGLLVHHGMTRDIVSDALRTACFKRQLLG